MLFPSSANRDSLIHIFLQQIVIAYYALGLVFKTGDTDHDPAFMKLMFFWGKGVNEQINVPEIYQVTHNNRIKDISACKGITWA